MQYKLPIIVGVSLVTLSAIMGITYSEALYGGNVNNGDLDIYAELEQNREQAEKLWPMTVEIGEDAIRAILTNSTLPDLNDYLEKDQ